jgi:Ca2+-binding EF-hand superfamily protein
MTWLKEASVPTRILIATALLAGTAVAAQAQNAQVPNRADVVKKLDDGFNQLDKNNDGFLNKDEVAAAESKALQQAQNNVDAKIAEQFSKIDADKNGSITLAEFKAAAKVRSNQSPEEILSKWDANKDGKVSAAEFKGTALAAFDRADLNHDGKISPDEQAKARAAR